MGTEIKIEIPNCKLLPSITLSGASIAGIRTALYIKELNLGFDAGWCDEQAIDATSVVAITHGHHDHIGALHMHAAGRRLRKMPVPSYIMPECLIDLFQKAYDAYKMLNGDAQVKTRHYSVYPAHLAFPLPRKNWTLLSFPTKHKVPSCGYVVQCEKKKLKPEHASKTPTQLRQLSQDGHALSEVVVEKILAFSGDTCIEGLLDHKEILSCPLLIVESTYIDLPKEDPRYIDPDKAKQRGHIHELDIIKHLDRFHCSVLVLTHLSKVYKEKDRAGLRDRIQEKFLLHQHACRVYIF